MLPLLALAFLSMTNTEDVRDLATRADGSILAATGGGLDVFDAAGRPLRTVHVEDGLPSHETWAVRVVGDSVFVATSHGVARLGATLALVKVIAPDRSWQALAEPEGDDADRYARQLEQLSTLLAAGELPVAVARSEHELAVAGADGWVRMHERAATADDHPRALAVSGRVRAMAFAADGLLDVVTTEDLLRLDFKRGRTTTLPSKLARPLVARATPEGLLVVEAGGAELLFTSGGVVVTGRRLPSRTVAISPDGRYVGREGLGVHDASGRRLTATAQLCSNHVVDLVEYEGRLVAGTFDRGICWSSDGVRWTSFRTPALPSNIVYGVAVVGRELWVATPAGAARWNGKAFEHLSSAGRNPLHFGHLGLLGIRPMGERTAFIDPRGVSWTDGHAQFVARDETLAARSKHLTATAAAGQTLWVGTEDRGLLRLDGTTVRAYHDARDLPDNWVTAVAARPDGTALVGTCQHGAALIRPHGPTLRFASADGLADDMVTAVALDASGGFVGTLGGLTRLDGEAPGRSWRARDGLADDRVAMVTELRGEVWVGTEAGLSHAPLGAAVAER